MNQDQCKLCRSEEDLFDSPSGVYCFKCLVPLSLDALRRQYPEEVSQASVDYCTARRMVELGIDLC